MEIKNSGVPEPLPAAVGASPIPGIESSTYFYVADETRVRDRDRREKRQKEFKSKGIVYADSAYLPLLDTAGWLAPAPTRTG